MMEHVTPEEMSALLSGAAQLTEGDEKQSAGVVTFDFRRQEKMSKENEQTLRMVMGNLGRYMSGALSTLLRSVVRLDMNGLAEASLEAFTAELPPFCLMAICSLPPLEGKFILLLDPEFCLACIERLRGGPGDVPDEVRELTEIETVLLRVVVERILGCIKEVFGTIVAVEPVIDQLETRSHFVPLSTGSDVAVVIDYGVSVRTVAGEVKLCMPYQMLKPITPHLHKHLWFQESDRPAHQDASQTLETRRTVMNTQVEIRALLGEATISVAELLDLQEGDCVVLDRQEKEELPLLIAGQQRLRGRLGVVGRRYGILITDWIEDHVGGPDTCSTGSEDDSHDSE